MLYRDLRKLSPKEKLERLENRNNSQNLLQNSDIRDFILLYKDISVVNSLYELIEIESYYDPLLGLSKKFWSNPLSFDNNTLRSINGLDEIILKPTAKLNTPLTIGTDLEFKLNLNPRSKLFVALRRLINALSVSEMSVDQVVTRVNSQNDSTKSRNLVYPGMQAVLSGKIKYKKDVTESELVVRGYRTKVHVMLGDHHHFEELFQIVKNRVIHVFGILQGISNPIKIKPAIIILLKH